MNDKSVEKVIISVPLKADLLGKSKEVYIASNKGEKWDKHQVGEFVHQRGIYIIHSNNNVLYVGQTTKPNSWASFGNRLRRHFQKCASNNSHLHKKLAELDFSIHCSFITLNEVDNMICSDERQINMERKVKILEQILIESLGPTENKV